MTTAAFDVDGTLIDYEDNPREDVLSLLRALQGLGCNIIVWSGGGQHYAENWVHNLRRLKMLRGEVTATAKSRDVQVDIAIDDVEVDLGTVNICVGPGGC